MKSYADSRIRTFFIGKTVELIKTDLHLNEYVHPSFNECMLELEESIVRMQMGTEMLLNRFGTNASERHIDIRKLGEAAIRNYAMFASVGRASRSYCIGLRHSAYETVAAVSLVNLHASHILEMILDIKNSLDGDEKHQNVAKLFLNSQSTWPSIVSNSNEI